MNGKVYEYEALVCEADGKGGAYVSFPYDIREEFGRGRVKVHATFDGEPYDGSVVNMGVGFLTLVNRIIWQKPHNCGFFYVKFIKI